MAASILIGDSSEKLLKEFCVALDIPLKTVCRWRKWWNQIFVTTNHWKILKGLFKSPVDESNLPSSLLTLHKTSIVSEHEALIWLTNLLITRDF
jgi:hypothetical protein